MCNGVCIRFQKFIGYDNHYCQGCAKFINKKEQVFDLKLTSYGHYLLAVGQFKPTYYAFYDDNVLYDAGHARIFERQNEIQNRIKNDTQYLESLVLFQNMASYL